jgi:hypothetical protein
VPGGAENEASTHKKAAPRKVRLFVETEVLRTGVPIYHVPEGGDIVGALVLVVKVVGVFPDIEGDDGFASDASNGGAHQRAVLIGGGTDGELLVGGHIEPGPT